jgi:hypothetical protein
MRFIGAPGLAVTGTLEYSSNSVTSVPKVHDHILCRLGAVPNRHTISEMVSRIRDVDPLCVQEVCRALNTGLDLDFRQEMLSGTSAMWKSTGLYPIELLKFGSVRFLTKFD